MAVVRVELGDRAYDVVVGDRIGGLGEALTERGFTHRAVVVCDHAVAGSWGMEVSMELSAGGIASAFVPVEVSEATKNVATWTRVVSALLDQGIDRRTPVVAVGGGVMGDIAGFAAATAMRGVPFVQVPTTLLAMVDSSVGGKTGVNHPLGKNLIGAFHQPSLVWAALETLSTLPIEETRAGLAEVVKTALLGDAELFAELEANAEGLAAGETHLLEPVIARCVAVKAAVVARDEREGGWRAVLNAGHTVGHAYEAVLGYGALRHGEAVALGLVAEARWAVRHGLCPDARVVDRLVSLLERLQLPVEAPAADVDDLVAAMRRDKKGRGDRLALPVPTGIGGIVLTEIAFDDLVDLLQEPA